MNLVDSSGSFGERGKVEDPPNLALLQLAFPLNLLTLLFDPYGIRMS